MDRESLLKQDYAIPPVMLPQEWEMATDEDTHMSYTSVAVFM